MMFKRLNEWLLPLTIIAFMGSNIFYLSAIFSSSIRWIIVIVLGIQVLLRKEKKSVPPALLVTIYLYTLWCLTTGLWSEQSTLTIMKAIAATIVLFSCLFGAQTWFSARAEESQAMNYLGPFSMLTLAVAVLGYFFSPSPFSAYGMFQGFTYNPNVFGAFAAMASTYFIWMAYKHRTEKKLRGFWLVVYSINFFALIMSQSRTALLMALCVLSGFLMVISVRNLLKFFYLISFFAIIFFVLVPAAKDKIISQVIYKGSTNVLDTREEVWSDSLEKAQEGGWFGGGYGVSIGAENWAGGFSANSYGREKGNSQLAVLEETGIVGFILYSSMIFIILKEFYAGYRAAKSSDLKVAISLVMGAVIGMIAQSIFEGWWVALGSADAVLFWTTIGVGMGLRTNAIHQSRVIRYSPGPI